MRLRSFVCAVVLIFVAACGGSVTQQADRTLSTVLSATNAARESFLAWDSARQTEIVDRAVSRELGERQLADYRARRGVILNAFTIAYSAIAAAESLIPLVDAGERKESELLLYVSDAVKAVVEVKRSIDGINGVLKP